MIGGAHDPAAVALSDEELVAEARADLARAMKLTAAPERTWVFRHPLGIGQYTVGHGARLERIAAALADHPGLHVAGQSYFGIAMNAAIEQAPKTAAAVLAGLG
jgi:oxygen-dependent protoporphyrinogen oxidase